MTAQPRPGSDTATVERVREPWLLYVHGTALTVRGGVLTVATARDIVLDMDVDPGAPIDLLAVRINGVPATWDADSGTISPDQTPSAVWTSSHRRRPSVIWTPRRSNRAPHSLESRAPR